MRPLESLPTKSNAAYKCSWRYCIQNGTFALQIPDDVEIEKHSKEVAV